MSNQERDQLVWKYLLQTNHQGKEPLSNIEKSEVLPPLDKKGAEQLHEQILALINKTVKNESELDKGYIALARMVFIIQSKNYWTVLGYGSWRDYFNFLQEKFGKGRTSLYGYIGTVRALQEHVTDNDMLDMGVTRASELKKAVQLSGVSPSDDLIKHALNKKLTLPEFREKVYKEYNITDHNEKGEWYDLSGVYFTKDEREEFEKAVKITKQQDPPVSNTLPKHSQFKEVLQRWIAEFLGTYNTEE